MEDLLTDLLAKPVPASKTKRWVACIIDYIIYFVLFTIITYSFGDVVIDEDHDRLHQLTGVAGFLAVVLPWFLLFPGIEFYNKGQTIGKAIFRIRTVEEDGSSLTLGKAVVRHLFDLIDYLPFLGITGIVVASNTKNKQRVGDLVANTIVVEVK
jgi:uncharacterized RDD family membrane protein YckC